MGLRPAVWCLGLLVTTSALAQVKPPPGVYYRATFVGRMNPIGMFAEAQVGHRWHLSNSESPLLKWTYLTVGLSGSATPNYLRPGLVIEMQPLSVLNLQVRYELSRFLGSYGVLQTFPGPNADYRDATLVAGPNRAGAGRQLTLQAAPQMKLGRVLARSAWRAIRVDVDASGDATYYDNVHDVLAPTAGWLLVSDTDVGALPGPGLFLGLRHSWVHSFLPPGTSAAFGGDPSNTHRLGPVASYTFYEDTGKARFNAPTAFLTAQWWLQHPYRTGQVSSPFMPCVLAGFSFRGDL
jgi:hypothetical protein